MKLTFRLFGREVLSIDLSDPDAYEYVDNTGGVIEEGPGDDGTRYAPGFDEDQCFEKVTFPTGFAG